jgi:hypothetical protein
VAHERAPRQDRLGRRRDLSGTEGGKNLGKNAESVEGDVYSVEPTKERKETGPYRSPGKAAAAATIAHTNEVENRPPSSNQSSDNWNETVGVFLRPVRFS